MARRSVTPKKLTNIKAVWERPTIFTQPEKPSNLLLQDNRSKIMTQSPQNRSKKPLPSFLYDFIDAKPVSKTGTPKNSTLASLTPSAKAISIKKETLKSPKSAQFPVTRSMNYRAFASHKKPKKEDCLYKPFVVHFGPRSKMTLYTANATEEKGNLKSCRTPAVNRRRVERIDEQSEKKEDPPVKDIKVAFTYAQKVMKVQEMAASVFH